MAEFIAYLCNDHNLTSVLFDALQIDTPRQKPSSIGWIQDGRSLLREQPKPTQNFTLTRVMGDVPSRSIIGYVADEPSNLQPIRFRRWLFAHDGEFSELHETQDAFLDDVPDFIRASVGEATGSQIVFQKFLASLHGNDILDAQIPPAEMCAAALMNAMTASLLEAAVADFGAVAVSERAIVASSFNHPLYFQVIRGLERPLETLFAGHQPKPTQYPNFKAIVVTNIEPEQREGWSVVDDQTTLYVDRNWDVQTLRGI